MEVRCINCAHEWDYKGKLLKATCPSCGKKTPAEVEVGEE